MTNLYKFLRLYSEALLANFFLRYFGTANETMSLLSLKLMALLLNNM